MCFDYMYDCRRTRRQAWRLGRQQMMSDSQNLRPSVMKESESLAVRKYVEQLVNLVMEKNMS